MVGYDDLILTCSGFDRRQLNILNRSHIWQDFCAVYDGRLVTGSRDGQIVVGIGLVRAGFLTVFKRRCRQFDRIGLSGIVCVEFFDGGSFLIRILNSDRCTLNRDKPDRGGHLNG